MERKGEKIMAFFNDVATKPQNYFELYGRGPVRETPLGKPQNYDSGTIVERFILRREDGQRPFGSKKLVTLPDNSPLRRFGLDKFELTKEKFPVLWDDNVAPGLKKTLKLFNKNGEVMFEGTGSIRQFMKSIAHVIRKG